MVESWQKVLLFLLRTFLYRRPISLYKFNFNQHFFWWEIKRDVRRIVDEKEYRKAQ